MSYRDDKIKILELLCARTSPMDLDNEKTQVIVVDEDELKHIGFSYYGAMSFLKDFYEEIRQIDDIVEPDGKRKLRIFAENIDNLLFILKYPNHQMESWIEEEEMNSQFVPAPEKISITIDNKKGIYQTDKPKKVYQIKIPSKKFSLITLLSQSEKVALSEFEEKLGQDKTVIMKAVKEINDIFMKKLSVVNPLIIRLDTSGYSLNKEKFDIKIN